MRKSRFASFTTLPEGFQHRNTLDKVSDRCDFHRHNDYFIRQSYAHKLFQKTLFGKQWQLFKNWQMSTGIVLALTCRASALSLS